MPMIVTYVIHQIENCSVVIIRRLVDGYFSHMYVFRFISMLFFCIFFIIHRFIYRTAYNLLSCNAENFYFCVLDEALCISDLPEKSIIMPPFVDGAHCLTYHLNKSGRIMAERVVAVLGYAYPDITYSPTVFPITSILLHFMSGKYNYSF